MINILISLVGSNSVPVYCLNKYLLGEFRTQEECKQIPKPNKLLFVFSDDTKIYYEGIKKRLENECENMIEVCNLQSNQNYADMIEKQIKEKLDEINSKDEIKTIILNNTGGTKPMAIYSTVAVYRFAKKHSNVQEIECYIDPNQNKIRINSLIHPEKYNSNNNYLPRDKDLRFYLRDTTMEDILTIHGMPLNYYGTNNEKLLPNFYENIKIISKKKLKEFAYNILNKDEYQTEYTNFFSLLRMLEYMSKENNYKLYMKLLKEYYGIELDEDRRINPLNKENFKNIFNSYLEKKESSWLKESLPSITEILDSINNGDDAEDIYKFLSGTWLEYYIMIAAEEAIEKAGLKEEIKLFHSFVCYLDKNNKGSHFEVDLIALKGYQLIAFTCTTDSTKPLTKSKSFEGLHRVEQLGGEHAKLCIVNMADSRDELDRQLVGFNSNFYKSKEIICKEDLKSYDYLVKRLKDILER